MTVASLFPRQGNPLKFTPAKKTKSSVEDFWVESLKGTEAAQFPEIPINYQPVASALYHHEMTSLHWPGISGLEWTSSNDAATIIQVAWAMLIAQYTNSTDIVMGRATDGGLIPLRVQLDWHANIAEATKVIRQYVQQATAHTGCHLASLRSLSPDAERACDFQFTLTIRNQQLPGVGSDTYTSYALSAICEIRDRGLSMQLRYDPTVLGDDDAERIAWQMDHLVRQLTKVDAATTLNGIDLLSSHDRQQIWSYNALVPARIDETITRVLEAKAGEHPDSLALDAWDGQMDYHQLVKASERLSSWLVLQGVVAPGRRVPVCIEKSLWTTVIILAIARGGGVFVVLDPAMPITHLSRIVEDLQATHTICTPKTAEVARGLGIPVFMMDSLQMTIRAGHPHLHHGDVAAEPRVTGDSPLYVVYTSGSTGAPKGAVISHANLCSAARHQAPKLGFNSETRSFDYSSYSFDAYIFNTFYTLLTGGCLCVPSDDDRLAGLQGAIKRMNVNLVQLTPSVARLIDPETIPRVKTLILTGEKIQVTDLLPWLGRVRVTNAYGPSECTIMCAANVDLTRPDAALSIGTGLGCNLWLQDAVNASRLAPVGAVGEIVIEGPIVGIGYLGNDHMAKQTHVANPQWLLEGPDGDGRSGRRGVVYRTGDFARYASDGTLVFLGRADSQTKLHGQRIETAAIESHLRRILPQGYECAVDVSSTSSHAQLLVGFLRRPDDLSENLGEIHKLVANIKELLRRQLPLFMVPSLFLPLSRIPMTNSGKIDRRRLRLMAADASQEAWVDGAVGGDMSWPDRNEDGVEGDPASPSELALKRLWVRVLGYRCAAVKPQDSFFQCGGDSITAIKLVAAATREGYKLDVPTVLRNPRLSDMAGFLIDDISRRSDVPAANGFSSASLLGRASSGLLQHLARSCHVELEDIEDVYPCSAIQEVMLSTTAQRPGSFIMQKVIPLPAAVDVEKMREAWDSVVAANQILRTRAVDTTTGGLLQVVVRQLTGTRARAGTIPRVRELNSMDRGSPLVYVNFATSSLDGDGIGGNFMVLTMHHAVYDAWSMDVYLRQLLQAYEGKSLIPSVPYRNFIEHVAKTDFQAAERYWSQQLATTEAQQFPALPGKDFQPLAQSVVQHHARNISWPSQTGITPATIVRASCAMLLASYTNSSDVVFGATVLGRQSSIPSIERLTGPTIATLPVRAVLKWDATAHEVLTAFQAQALDAIPFEQYGIGRIRRLNHGASQACRFQTLLVVQAPEDESQDEPLGAALRYRMEDEDIGAFSTQALTIICFPEPDGLRLCLSFDDRVLTESQAGRMASQIEHVLRQFCTRDLRRTQLRHIETAGPEDMERIWGWNASVPETVSACVHDAIAATAAQQPDALAVDGWDGRFTYAELLRTATRLASRLQSMGVGPEVMVPTCFEKSAWAAVSMLAVIMAGGVGVALDASQPEERLRHIIAQTEARLVLAGAQTAELARRLALDVVVVGPTSFEGPDATVPENPVLSREQAPDADNALFVVFTSGSTGTPKGAVITHAGFSSATKHQRQAFGMTRTTRVLDFASYAFDVAWFDLLHTLTVGACVCIPSDSARRDNLVATIRQFDANYLFLTPSLGRYLDSRCAPTIKDLIMGGEGVGRGDMTGWSDDVRVRVAYGPAECTVMSNVAVFSAGHIPDLIHTGPGLGVNCWVVSSFNPDLLAPLGAVGELVLEGPLLGRGYLGDPDKTAAAFTNDPAWLSRGGAGNRGRSGRVYHTGDLVRFTDEGALAIIGRKDAQVKIRGQRVELEEVETHARRLLPDCQSSSATLAADVVIPQGQTSKMLVLFIAGVGKMDAAVRDHVLRGLAEALPVYMVPSAFVSLPTIPTTATGKVSRKGLRELAAAVPLEQFFADSDGRNGHAPKKPPATAVEKQLHALWAEILRLDASDIGLESNFLHVGGDSVSAMRLAGHAHERGLPLTVAMILQQPRLNDMSRSLSDALRSHPVQPSVNQPEANQQNAQNRRKSAIAKLAQSAARKLGSTEDNIVDILPVTEFQQHSIRCAALRPRAEWGFFAVSLTGVAPARLRQACERLCEAVEIFRTIFVPLGDEPALQAVVLRHLQPDIVVRDADGSLDAAMYSFCSEVLSREFLPGHPTTAFAILHQPQAQKTRLVMSMSHAHYDGLSLSLIAETLAASYQERPVPRLVSFSRFIRKSLLRTPANYQYWRRLLRGSSMTTIPRDPGSHDGRSRARTKVCTEIPSVQARDGVTAATVIYAGWARVLSSLTGATDVVFGRLVSGRNSANAGGFHNVVGPCINYVPVRAKLGDAEERRVLADLQEQYIRGLQHEALGPSEIVDQCTDWPAASVFGSTVHYQNVGEEPLFSLDGQNYIRLETVENSGEADAPGCVRVAAIPSGSRCKLELSMPPEFGSCEAHRILDSLADAIAFFNAFH